MLFAFNLMLDWRAMTFTVHRHHDLRFTLCQSSAMTFVFTQYSFWPSFKHGLIYHTFWQTKKNHFDRKLVFGTLHRHCPYSTKYQYWVVIQLLGSTEGRHLWWIVPPSYFTAIQHLSLFHQASRKSITPSPPSLFTQLGDTQRVLWSCWRYDYGCGKFISSVHYHPFVHTLWYIIGMRHWFHNIFSL